jgi:hypothetical protein
MGILSLHCQGHIFQVEIDAAAPHYRGDELFSDGETSEM